MSQFHLIAPSGYCINQDAAQRGVQRLLESGHQVENQTIIPRRQQRFAGTEAQRLNDINSLVSLKGKDRIVLAVRGGYGASRLLESIDWQGLAQRQQQDPLLICGHSDFTVIQLGLLALHNVITFSGPMLAGNFGAPELDAFTMEHFWRALRNPAYSVEWQGNGPHWECEGQLWGGNLGDAGLAHRHAVDAGHRRRHSGAGRYQRTSVPRRAHAIAALSCRYSCASVRDCAGQL